MRRIKSSEDISHLHGSITFQEFTKLLYKQIGAGRHPVCKIDRVDFDLSV